MALINEAYRVLGDPGRRAQYDRGLDGRRSSTGSAAPSPTYGESGRPSRSPGPYNYPTQPIPARFPWRMLTLMAVGGVSIVLLGAALIQPPADREPDGILRPGSCVAIEPNNDVREVSCTGSGDLVVDQLVPSSDSCPSRTDPHRDRQGLGIACVRRAAG